MTYIEIFTLSIWITFTILFGVIIKQLNILEKRIEELEKE